MRWLVSGERNCRINDACDACTSTPSRPPATTWPATRANPSTSAAIRSVDNARGTSRNIGSAMSDGASTGAREYRPDAWPPWCPIWASTAAPWVCTASAIARYPGTTAGSVPRTSFSYGRSSGSTDCSSVITSPTPPAARAP